MSITRFLFASTFLLGCLHSVAQVPSAQSFTTETSTALPGAVLKPGSYSIQILDHLADRSVLRVTSDKSDAAFTFLGVNASSTSFSGSGPVFWTKGVSGDQAMRGFAFPGGERLDFVYPKDEAVAIATANKEGVVAVDPKSEHRPELSKLTPNDLQLVTLWSLNPVTVGPAKGLEAKRFVPSRTDQVASSPAPLPTDAKPGPSAAPATQSAPVLEAKLQRPHMASAPYVKRLPKTSSYAPLAGLIALVSLCGAVGMSLRRAG